ncbi:Phosphotriesterase-related protein [Geodia barretti]|uniref:Phosphotriesterase-related protein n=1 Tax=Geodia barretti TaxID=519541 RepID=A0AA35R6D6_GEOBA|nr:Phosphotriesterase-related protein [Geodia barretti]
MTPIPGRWQALLCAPERSCYAGSHLTTGDLRHAIRPESGSGPDRARSCTSIGAGLHHHPRAPLRRLLLHVPPGPGLAVPELAEAPITLENLGWIRRNYYSNRSNLELMDLDTAIGEVRKYSEIGGGAIVDATTTGIGRNPNALARISRESGRSYHYGRRFLR